MNRFLCFFFGTCVGQDDYGNLYFEGRWKGPQGKPRRWVYYGVKEKDPSNVPAQWHGWLHQVEKSPPRQSTIDLYFWQKPHAPNGEIKSRSTLATQPVQDYAPWKPAESKSALNQKED